MTNTIKITIEGNDLDTDQNGDWQFSIMKNGLLCASGGLYGSPNQILQYCREGAIENAINLSEGEQHE